MLYYLARYQSLAPAGILNLIDDIESRAGRHASLAGDIAW